MNTDFFIVSGQTVPDNYIWDNGIPLNTAGTIKNNDRTTTTFITGYAPGLRVIFKNNSTPDPNYDQTTYTWNFGDYYNDTNNTISLSCASGLVDHLYVMPGAYNVSLNIYQTKTSGSNDVSVATFCRSKYDINWYWDNLNDTDQNNITWDETKSSAATIPDRAGPKTWTDEFKCFERYCTFWDWRSLDNSSRNITWEQTEDDAIYEKRWMFQANNEICTTSQAPYLSTASVVQQTTTKTFMVSVIEIPPVARLESATRPTYGISPFTVQLSPRKTTTGSFPIDRIDWDLGDGTPIKTFTSYSTPLDTNVINTSAFSADLNDVRNYDILHTYTLNKNTYPVFYPSITCYSANTNTFDSCSVTIGPISLSSTPQNLHVLKVRNTLKGNLYTFSTNDNITFSTTVSTSNTIVNTPLINTPKNIIRDSYGLQQNYFGNAGLNYPPVISYYCGDNISDNIPDTFVATESGTIVNNVTYDREPIYTQSSFALIP